MYEGRLRRRRRASRTRRWIDLPGVRPDALRPRAVALHRLLGQGLQRAAQRRRPEHEQPGPSRAHRARSAQAARRAASRPQQIAVITPYLAQARRLREALRDATLRGPRDRHGRRLSRPRKRSRRRRPRAQQRRRRDRLPRRHAAHERRDHARTALPTRGRRQRARSRTTPYYQRFMDAAEQTGAYLSAWSDEADPL